MVSPRSPDQDVRWLDVTVDDAALVSVRARMRGRHHRRDEREPLGDGLALGDELLEWAPADLPHDVARCSVRPDARVVDRDDRGMLEPRGDPGLAGEPAQRIVIHRARFLQRDHTSERGIGGLDDTAHPAPRDLRPELVANGWHRRRRTTDRRRVAAQRRHRGAIESAGSLESTPASPRTVGLTPIADLGSSATREVQVGSARRRGQRREQVALHRANQRP